MSMIPEMDFACNERGPREDCAVDSTPWRGKSTNDFSINSEVFNGKHNSGSELDLKMAKIKAAEQPSPSTLSYKLLDFRHSPNSKVVSSSTTSTRRRR